MITPVVTVATGTATKGLKNNLEAIQREHSVDSVQRTAVLGTSHNTEGTAV